VLSKKVIPLLLGSWGLTMFILCRCPDSLPLSRSNYHFTAKISKLLRNHSGLWWAGMCAGDGIPGSWTVSHHASSSSCVAPSSLRGLSIYDVDYWHWAPILRSMA
jgi:hypothetical protein